MSYTGNKVFNIFINSANRSSTDKTYDFTIYFDNDEILINPNEGVNVNVVSFNSPLLYRLGRQRCIQLYAWVTLT